MWGKGGRYRDCSRGPFPLTGGPRGQGRCQGQGAVAMGRKAQCISGEGWAAAELLQTVLRASVFTPCPYHVPAH